MSTAAFAGWIALAVHVSFQVGFILRALLRPHRDPSSRVAWVLVIIGAPLVGMLAYVLFGETNIGRARLSQYRASADRLDPLRPDDTETEAFEHADPSNRHLFRVGQSISGFWPVAGNKAEIMAGSREAVEALIRDIDSAQDHVHLLFYIWLTDESGTAVIEAAKRAALRGVTVRAMADDVGSRALIKSRHWTDMAASGVKLARALPVSNPILHPVRGRVDLRNHRKIAVIDNAITYCGSQNCADAEFRVKAKYAPWIDVMVRFQGPIVLQNQMLFAEDWMTHVDEDLSPLLRQIVPPAAEPGIVAQVIGTGPIVRPTAMPEMFEVLIHAARNELVITTPYYVPTEAMQSALCASGRRGVTTILVLPRRNDSFVVAAASRSYYADLLEAGVRIFEYPLGLLHSKTLVIDGSAGMIGSANLDRRSFELNYENNILFEDRDLAAGLRRRQQDYIDVSAEVTATDVARWTLRDRLWNNTVAMLGPVL